MRDAHKLTKFGYEPPPGACYLPELDPRNQPRAYTRLTFEGVGCLMEPEEAAAIMRDEPGVYTASTEWMPPALFDKLPEFAGW